MHRQLPEQVHHYVHSQVFVNLYIDIEVHLFFRGEERGLFVTFLCNSKQIIDCILKCIMIYTNLCIIYSTGIALYACVK